MIEWVEKHKKHIKYLELQREAGTADPEELAELKSAVRLVGDTDFPLVVPASPLTVEEWEAQCRAAEADIAAKAAEEDAKRKAEMPPATIHKAAGEMPVRPSKPKQKRK